MESAYWYYVSSIVKTDIRGKRKDCTMSHNSIDRIRSAIKASLPNARIILVGSYYYNEQIATSDYDLLVLSNFPVRRSKKQEIVTRLARDKIKYDIHFMPKLFIFLRWKYIAGKDLDSGENIQLRLTGKVRSAVFASRIKMAYYYYLTKEYNNSIIALLRAKIIPDAVTDIDIFSFAGNLQLLERCRSKLSDEEYSLYKKALLNRADARGEVTDTRLLLALINEVFQHSPDNLFQVQHNLQYCVYSIRRGSLRVLVNYNGAITCALHHYMNDNPEESTRQLSKLTKVTDLDAQLKEYSCLSVLEIKN